MSYKFNVPKLRNGVCISEISDRSIEIKYHNISMLTEFESHEKKSIFLYICEQLLLGVDEKELFSIAKKKYIDTSFVQSILDSLDDEKLIIEAPVLSSCISGIDLAFLIEDLYYNKWKYEFGETQLTSLILNGDAGKDLVVGWALEYYHVTKGAHDAILSVIPNLTGDMKLMALDFFEEEFRHDKIMLKAIESIGVDKSNLESSVPLPATLAYINMLGYWAMKDPYTFVASIFIYEGERADYTNYIDSLSQYKFNDAFIDPQKNHNDINVDGDHFGESRRFLQKISSISADKEDEVKRNLFSLLKVERQLHQEILEYYSNPEIGIPRKLENVH